MGGYSLTDTIVAAATPLAASALAVLRLSGPEAWDIAEGVLGGLPAGIEHRHAYVVTVPLPDQPSLSDKAIATFYRAPQSYTGEDCAEITLHGSPLLVRHVLALLQAGGARPAEAGEFTYRAYLSGKLDLSQAEAVQQLISAGSSRALALAAAQLAGLPSRRAQLWVEELTDLLAGIEVIHDYAADDLDATLDQETLLTPARLRGALEALVTQMGDALAASERSAPSREGITVAILGPPNVGKSTLFNALLGQERAITAPEPGTTRDYLTETLAGGSLRLTLVDTAGYRDAADAVEAAGIRRGVEWGRAADRVLWVTAADAASYIGPPESLQDAYILRVATRSDLVNEPLSDNGHIDYRVSGLTGAGIDDLRDALAGLPEQLPEPALDSFGRRQAAQVQSAKDALARAIAGLEDGAPFDIAAAELYAAVDALHGIFEQADREEVVQRIFSGFCVGK